MASIDFAKRPGGSTGTKRKASGLNDRRFVPRVSEFVRVCANKPTVEEIIDYLQESFPEYGRKKRNALRQYVIKALAIVLENKSNQATELEKGVGNYMERRQKRMRREGEEQEEEEEEVVEESDASNGVEEELVEYKDTNMINNSLKNLYKNVSNNKEKTNPPLQRPSQIIDLTDNNTAERNSVPAPALQSPRRPKAQRTPTKTITIPPRNVAQGSPRNTPQTMAKNEPLSPRQTPTSQLFTKALSSIQVFAKNCPAKVTPAKSKINIHASLLDGRMQNGTATRVPLENVDCLEVKPEVELTATFENGNHGVGNANHGVIDVGNRNYGVTGVGNANYGVTGVGNANYGVTGVGNGHPNVENGQHFIPVIPIRDETGVSAPVSNKNLTSIVSKDERNASSRSSTPVDKGRTYKKKGDQTKEAKKRFEPMISTKTFKDVGGYESCIQEVSKLLLHLKHPEVFTTIGIKPPRGFLLHGPPGCGKTLLANAIAGELGIPLFNVSAPEIVSGISGDSEQRVRSLFVEALAVAPSIIFIDEIDSITPKREEAGKEMERRIVTQILTCMDGLAESDSHVLVIGATNRPDSLDPALRRAGRFDREIAMGIPDRSARRSILECICSGLRLSPDFDFETIAVKTPGYVGADMEALKREAAICAVDSVFKSLEEQRINLRPLTKTFGETSSYKDTNSTAWLRDEPPLSEDQLASLYISTHHFEDALPHVQPSAKREGFATVPDVTWDDIGALEDIREELTMAIMAPVQNPEAFESLGLSTPPGILLCGPPGCGKTLLAKAVANEAGINFISVKGPELLNMYVGESEKAVRQVFMRARSSSPCVIFFDEIDALCPQRSQTGDSNVTSRVVNQLLTEMDGLEARKSVFIMGATNRPDILDRAILRPGRMDKQLYVGLPNCVDRCKILRTITKDGRKPCFSSDVSIEGLAANEWCEGFSGADLNALVREASIAALREFMKKRNNSVVERNSVVEEDEETTNEEDTLSNVSSAETENEMKAAAAETAPGETCDHPGQSQLTQVMEDPDTSAHSAHDPEHVILTHTGNNGDVPSMSNQEHQQDAAVSQGNTTNVDENIIPQPTTFEEEKQETMETDGSIPSNTDAPTTDDSHFEEEEKAKTVTEIVDTVSLNADSPAVADFQISSFNSLKEGTEDVIDSTSADVEESPSTTDFQIGPVDDENHVHVIDTSIEEMEEDEEPATVLTDDEPQNYEHIIVNPKPLSTIVVGPSKCSQTKIIVTNAHFALAFQKVKPSVSEKDRIWYEKMKSRKGER